MTILTLFSLGATLLQSAPAQAPAPRLATFLRQSIGLDADQIAAAERGDAVVKVLETANRRDVAIFGIITTPAARSDYIARVRDFQHSLQTPTRTRFGIFSDPATLSDVDNVLIPQRDVEEMKDCKPGDCVAKLPATDMLRIHEEAKWSAPPAELQAQLSAYAKRRLVEYVTDYRRRGDSALVIYDDRGTMHVRASEAFAAQLAESPYIYQTVPSLTRYLAAYPHGSLPDATEIIYWSEDVLPRLRPILSVTHQVVYSPPELPSSTLIVAKQIYANHYFETSLDMTGVMDRGTGAYVLVLRRYRFDNLPGGILNIRGKAIGALRDQLAADLKRQK